MERDSMTLEQILKGGEELYLNRFRAELEKSYIGQYAVIDVEKEAYVLDASKLTALDKAKKTFGTDRLFYIVEIGNLDTPTKNFRSHGLPAWGF